jgi:hypothetical protein
MNEHGETPVRMFLACDKCGEEVNRNTANLVHANDGNVLTLCKGTCDDRKLGNWSQIPSVLSFNMDGE